MKKTFRTNCFLALCAVCILVGCSGEDFGSVPVSGTVTLDGEPLAGVEVSFFPQPTESTSIVGPFSIGVTDADGKFELRTRYDKPGAVVGRHKVSFEYQGVDEEEAASAAEELAEAKASGDDTGEAQAAVKKAKSATKGKRKIPRRYKEEYSEVYYTVPAGGVSDVEFPMTSE